MGYLYKLRGGCRCPFLYYLQCSVNYLSNIDPVCDLRVIESDYNFGICVRTGQHCTQPLLSQYNVKSAVRVSFGIYNIEEEIDVFLKGLHKAMKMLKA